MGSSAVCRTALMLWYVRQLEMDNASLSAHTPDVPCFKQNTLRPVPQFHKTFPLQSFV